MSLEYVLTDVNVFVDEKTLAGSVRSVTLPKVEEKVEDHLGGGMMFPSEIQIGFNKLDAVFEYPEFNPQVMLKEGQRFGNDLPLTVYGYMRGDEGEETAAQAHLRGRFKVADPGVWKPGAVALQKVTFAVRYYELKIAGSLIYRIDTKNRVYVIGGQDLSANRRRILNLEA